MAKTHPLGFRIEQDIKDALTVAAKDDHRSVSSLVELIIAEMDATIRAISPARPERHLRPCLRPRRIATI